jgi:dihydrofolate reductase
VRKLIEETLVSVDGVFAGPRNGRYLEYRDDAYLRDGLGWLLASDAMLLGRNTYEAMAQVWPSRGGGGHPWADRLNAMKKYVFSSTLQETSWNNTTILRGEAAEEVRELKEQDGPNLMMWGHGLLTETLWKHQLVDVLELSIHPLVVGQGKPFFRDGLGADLRLVATKAYSNGIVKITYEPTY